MWFIGGVSMIIGYYHQLFFGGGTYYKLSKKAQDCKYKFEYCHSVIPNYIPNAEEFIKEYNTLSFKDEKFKELNEKLKVKNIEFNNYINEIIEIVNNSDWNKISNQEYTSNNLDDVCWDFYIEAENKKYFIKGYSVYPIEIEKIYDIFEKMQNDF